MDSPVISSSFRSFSNQSSPATSSSGTSSFSFFKFGTPSSHKTSAISVSSSDTRSNPHKPNLGWGKYSLSIKPPSNLVPILRNIGGLAAKTSSNVWVSVLRAGIDGETETLPEEFGGKYVQNGGIGMALLSVTATAKVKISPFVATLAANPTFVAGLWAWFVAQSIKVFLNFFVERKWDLRIMFASGGMPSSHSALCTALTTSVAICHGVADSLFPVCLGFSLIVMYDAIGVRRHAGIQAQVLNLILEDLFQGHPFSQTKLKELLGHTPSQVLAGALLGIVVACFCCQGCLVAAS